MISIEEKQKEIIERFSILDGDFEMTIRYLIELGGKLPAMKPEDKVDSNLIPGCLSKVWLTVKIEEGKLFFNADSNTETIKGLISLLIEVLNGRTPDEVINSNLFFFSALNLDRYITSQRGGGFGAMIKQMKFYGIAFKVKLETQS